MLNLSVTELTKENESCYLNQVVELENLVSVHMKNSGKSNEFFTTGKDDISDYVHSKNNTVMVLTNPDSKVLSAAYITQGQMPFTYNDITKYFKYGENYHQYVRSLYPEKTSYQKDMLNIYQVKLEAFQYAKEKILADHPEFDGNILTFLNHELKDEKNQFHEKSILRESLNQYMSEYIHQKQISQGINGLEEKYENFYHITSEEIAKEFGKTVNLNTCNQKDYESFMSSLQEEYKEILKKGSIKIHGTAQFDQSKYYHANTKNTIEIDTYITDPFKRHFGLARILVYEGVKKHITNYLTDPENQEVYLSSTLHKDNLSSKYVSEFFGLTDSLFVQRRQGISREVHICKIERENMKDYLNSIYDKLVVFYGYNPDRKVLSNQRKLEIVNEQLLYEKEQFKRLNNIRHSTTNYHGSMIKETRSKAEKIIKLKEMRKSFFKEESAIGEI